MFNIDTGSNSSDGPWLAWSARGTQDGSVPARTFFIRESTGKTPTQALDKGVVMDIHGMKTGWQRSDGVVGQAPEWRWNPSVTQMMQSPGEDWKKGFSIRCAIGGGATAAWEQSGAAVWDALVGLAPQLQQAPDGTSLPVVRLKESKLVQFKKGSTVTPILEVIKWVPRPDCLKEGAVAGIAIEPAAPVATPAPIAPPAPPAPALADDIEF